MSQFVQHFLLHVINNLNTAIFPLSRHFPTALTSVVVDGSNANEHRFAA